MLNVRNPNTGALLPGFQSRGELSNGPLNIRFTNYDAATGTYDYEITDNTPVPPAPAGANILETGSYDPKKVNEFFSGDPSDVNRYQGFQFEMTGEPAVGDGFTIDFNKNGVSDNRNAELLAALGTKIRSMAAPRTYGGLRWPGRGYRRETRQSQLDKDAGATLLEQSTNQRESVSGVNLDEEAGKLIQYQAAYNASAQVMSVAQDLFNTLLQSFR